MGARPVRVLVVDDSALVRALMSELLGDDPGIEVVGTAADLAEMADCLARLESLPPDPSPAQLAGHRRFHAALYRAAHNAPLVETLDGLWDKTDRYRRHALRAGRTEAEVARRAEEHRLLVEAVSDRDAAAATDLMRRHVETSLAARAAADEPTTEATTPRKKAAPKADAAADAPAADAAETPAAE